MAELSGRKCRLDVSLSKENKIKAGEKEGGEGGRGRYMKHKSCATIANACIHILICSCETSYAHDIMHYRLHDS